MESVTGRHGAVVVADDGTLRVTGPGFAAELVDAIFSGTLGGLQVEPGRLVVVPAVVAPRPGRHDAADDTAARADFAGRERSFGVDMTNVSVIVDDRWVIKLAGHFGAANRAAQQLSALATVGSPVTPPLAGRLDWVHPTRGTATIALVTELVEGATDGWSWAVDDVLTALTDAPDRPDPDWPARIGELTADLHTGLLRVRPADTASRSTGPGESPRARAESVLEAALSLTDGPAGVRLRAREPALRAAIGTLPSSLTATPGPWFFTHGDLHVGQFLRSGPATSGRYWIVDFDGDPQLDASARDRPDVAARDLAHLISSIDLVAAVVMRRLGRVDRRVLAWAARAGRDLRDAYAQRLAASGNSAAISPELLRGFIAEQALRELLYAARFLPRWKYAADAAITFRYPASPLTASLTTSTLTTSLMEEPWTPPDSATT